jgi:hypothetical protein
MHGDVSMLKFLKRVFESYINSVGRYPLPLAWAF